MLFFNLLLLVHFLAFIGYLTTLLLLWPQKDTAIRDHKGLIMGIIILLTGILLAAWKYPHINYYKIVPKTGMFVIITIINIYFSNKPFTKRAYFLLLILTILAACLAVWRF